MMTALCKELPDAGRDGLTRKDVQDPREIHLWISKARFGGF